MPRGLKGPTVWSEASAVTRWEQFCRDAEAPTIEQAQGDQRD